MDGTSPSAALQALEALRGCYQEFMDKLQVCRTAGLGEAIGFFFQSQGNPRVGQAVDEFNGVVTGRVAALAEALAELTEAEAAELAAQAMELMLFYPLPKDNTILFSLAAFEGRAQALVPFLSPEARQELAGRYAKRTPPRRMLPNQKKLWKELSR